VLYEVFSRVFVHIYTAFWAVVVTRGFTLAATRWRKRMSWTHPPSLALQLRNTIRLSLQRYLSIVLVCFSKISTLTAESLLHKLETRRHERFHDYSVLSDTPYCVYHFIFLHYVHIRQHVKVSNIFLLYKFWMTRKCYMVIRWMNFTSNKYKLEIKYA